MTLPSASLPVPTRFRTESLPLPPPAAPGPAGTRDGVPPGSGARDAPREARSLAQGDPPDAETADMAAAKPSGGGDRAREVHYVPADPLFANQWHLLNTGQSGGLAGIDINVLEVWDEFTGAGVTVGIWDDGVQYTHPDLDGNYDASLHILDSLNAVHDPAPQDPESAHGTAVAGVIAAENDGSGTVGVAFGATIAGVDIFFDPNIDIFEAFAQLRNFDVTNHSWGWTTSYNSNILDPGWDAFFDGLYDAAALGRGGLGSITVVSAGNDREEGRHTNDSNFTSVPYTIAVAAVSHDGFVSYYSTPGASVLISAPSNGAAGAGIWTTDRTGSDGYSTGTNEAGNPSADYTARFGGTSSAAPTLTGVVALMLEANPDLGWRDVQTILAHTARHAGSAIGSGPSGHELFTWGFNGARTWNGGGLHFSNDYGFGLVDALAAVRMAESWTERNTTANWQSLVAQTWSGAAVIPDNNPAGFTFTLDVGAGSATDLEHVGLRLDMTNAYFGDYHITLTSPEGTASVLAMDHDEGDSVTGSWFYLSHAFRGETGTGLWSVTVSDRWGGDIGTLTFAQLEFYGGAPDPDQTFVFTDEYSDHAGNSGHGLGVHDSDGGTDTLNLSAVTSASTVVLGDGGIIDGVALGSFAGQGPAITGTENIVGGDGADILTGDDAANEIRGMRGDDTIDGGDGGDSLWGGAGNDTILGGSGADRDALRGEEGHDTLLGGGGADDLSGDDGADSLWGEDGNDILDGGAENDTLYGGAGRDTLDGGSGDDQMTGGTDTDFYHIDSPGDTIIETSAQGNDLVTTTIALNLATLSQHVERATLTGAGDLNLTGNARNNVLTGSADNNDLVGSNGDDTLFGAAGDDRLFGGADNDRLIGGLGNDELTGGGGADSFVFTTGWGQDVIRDFSVANAAEFIDLGAVTAITSFGDLVANHLSTNLSGFAVIAVGANTLTIEGVSAASLTAAEFIF